jgi:hypothetical protein
MKGNCIMPKTLGGWFGFALMAVVTVVIGTMIINRVPPLRAFVNGQQKAA